MSTAGPATGAVDRVRSGTLPRLLLALIGLFALIRPGFVIYTEHVDGQFAEQPFWSLLLLGLVASSVIVPGAVLVLFVVRTWTAIEKLALLLLPVGWVLPWFVVPMEFGCSEVCGLAQPCAVTSVSTPREVIVLVMTACVASVAVWLHRRSIK